MSFLPVAAVALSAAAPIAGGIMESKGLRREAKALDEGARRDESQGAADAVDALRASRMQLGEDMASLAGSGFAIGSGSADDLLSAALIEREFEAMNIRESARLQAEEKRAAARERLEKLVEKSGDHGRAFDLYCQVLSDEKDFASPACSR